MERALSHGKVQRTGICKRLIPKTIRSVVKDNKNIAQKNKKTNTKR